MAEVDHAYEEFVKELPRDETNFETYGIADDVYEIAVAMGDGKPTPEFIAAVVEMMLEAEHMSAVFAYAPP